MTKLIPLLLLAFLGCSRAPEMEIKTAADLKGRHVAHMSSGFHRRELEAMQPGIHFDPYSEYAFAFESLRSRKIDAISIGKIYADLWQAKYPGAYMKAFDYADDNIAFLLPKRSPLKAELDGEIRRMKESGEMQSIIAKWLDAAKSDTVPELPVQPPPPAGARTVRVASAAQAEPWCFVAGGKLTGADMEILGVIATRLGWRMEPKIYSWGGMVDSINGGRADLANGSIYIGGLAFPTLDASEPYAQEKMCILVRNPDWKAEAGGVTAFVRSLVESFRRTFLVESRWRMMAKGLGFTLLITLLSTLLATLLALPIWRLRISKCRFAAETARKFIAILQGTPILVLLMVLFYLVFGAFDVDGFWVAVVGFGLNSSVNVAEMLRSGIDSIPAGQTEAALALGYPPRRAFRRFVLPQAIRIELPVYRGEVISLLKSTSIVGYIAINDLTKASDLIRSRTYESFFPVLTTAFIYFAAAWLLAWAIDRIGRRLEPGHGRRTGA